MEKTNNSNGSVIQEEDKKLVADTIRGVGVRFAERAPELAALLFLSLAYLYAQNMTAEKYQAATAAQEAITMKRLEDKDTKINLLVTDVMRFSQECLTAVKESTRAMGENTTMLRRLADKLDQPK